MGIQLERNPLVTTYFMEDIVRAGVSGCCQDVAYALHEMTGWKIGVLWKRNKDEPWRDIPDHVFCITPNGQQGIDIEGARPLEHLTRLRSDPFRKDRELALTTYDSIAEFTEALKNTAGEFFMEPRDYKVNAARKIIQAAPKFLELVNSLKAPPSRRRAPQTEPHP
jgi:hypothetical protein